MDKQYLKDVWNSVWEEGLTEQEVQKLYFEKLEKELKGEDRYMLKMLKHEMKIKEEFKDGFVSYLSNKND
tara:strand:+ start:339 stop:548 length:210 start_codon:yes stop_codon:yes gene_type:complete